MVNIKKNVLTQKQAKNENVGTYHHPTEKTWRSGACVIGQELREGHYRSGYTTKSGKKVKPTHVNASCSKTSNKGRTIKDEKIINNNEFRKEILTEKQALKKPIGSYYHPTETTWRSGACPDGEILKKGYKKKSYITKTGKVIPETYVNPVCVKDKGKKKGKKILNTKINTKKKKISPKTLNIIFMNNSLLNTTQDNLSKNNNSRSKTSIANTSKIHVAQNANAIKLKSKRINTLSSNLSKINQPKNNNTSKVNAPQANTSKANTSQVNAPQANTSQINVPQANTSQVNVSKTNASRVNLPQANVIQVNAAQVNAIRENESNNKKSNIKSLNKLYHNIKQTNVQELTNKMIINLMKINKL